MSNSQFTGDELVFLEVCNAGQISPTRLTVAASLTLSFLIHVVDAVHVTPPLYPGQPASQDAARASCCNGKTLLQRCVTEYNEHIALLKQ